MSNLTGVVLCFLFTFNVWAAEARGPSVRVAYIKHQICNSEEKMCDDILPYFSAGEIWIRAMNPTEIMSTFTDNRSQLTHRTSIAPGSLCRILKWEKSHLTVKANSGPDYLVELQMEGPVEGFGVGPKPCLPGTLFFISQNVFDAAFRAEEARIKAEKSQQLRRSDEQRLRDVRIQQNLERAKSLLK